LDPDRLKSIPLFQSLPEDALSQVATFAQEVSVESGRELVRQGDYSYEFMVIEEGAVEVKRAGEHVADLAAGDFFGEVGLLERDRRNATVVATEPTRLITLTGWDLKRLERTSPDAVSSIRSVIEQRRPA
jgi:CRP-like cAMP-binding protein